LGWEHVDWIRLAQNRDRLWAVVNTVMNLRAPENERNVFFFAEDTEMY